MSNAMTRNVCGYDKECLCFGWHDVDTDLCDWLFVKALEGFLVVVGIPMLVLTIPVWLPFLLIGLAVDAIRRR